MKIITGLILTLVFLFTGCAKTEQEPVNLLYQISAEEVLAAHRTSQMRPDGTYAYSKSAYDSEGNSLGGTYLAKPGVDTDLYTQLPLSSQCAERIYLGDRGIYTIEPSPESLSNKIFNVYSFEGTSLASVPLADIKPEGANGNYPGDNDSLPSILPMAESDSGILLLWGSHLLTLTDDLTVQSSEKLPGLGFGVFEDGGTWVLYREKQVMKLADLSAESAENETVYQVPTRFYGTGTFSQAQICAVHDGYAYAWDSYGLFRWDADDPAESGDITVTDMADFVGSGIPGSTLTLCAVDFENGISISARWAETVTGGTHTGIVYHLASLAPAGNTDGEFVTLELAHAMSNSRIDASIIEFNRTHDAVKITVTDYSRFNHAEDLSAGVTRLRMDLETGILKPDLLLLNDYQYGDMVRDMPGYFTDLYPLMTGEVKREDLWNSVHSFARDGSLYGIGTHISLRSLAGKSENLPGSRWNFGEALEFAAALNGNEYLMEDITQWTGRNLLLGYQAEKFSSPDAFTEPEFISFLNWLKTLPETAQTPVSSATVSDVLAGMASPDSVISESGENLHYSGRIKLMEITLDTVSKYLYAMNTFGAVSPEDLTWIGYPTEEESGTLITFGELLTIPVCGENPALAWDFAEWTLLRAGEELSASPDSPGMSFTSLKQPCIDYMTALTGTETFFAHAGYSMLGRDLHEKYENGRIDGTSGNLYTYDSAIMDAVSALLDSRCMTSAAQTDPDLEAIIREEITRFLSDAGTAESAAEAIRSRAGIYLAEHE